MNGRKKTTNVGLPAACRAAAAALLHDHVTVTGRLAPVQAEYQSQPPAFSVSMQWHNVVTVLQLAICLQQVEIFNGICQVCGITRYTPPGQQQSGRGGGQKKFRKI